MNPPSQAPETGTPSRQRWQRLVNASIIGFHRYAVWLVGISWKRFFLLALLLMITAGILESIPPFSWRISEVIESPTPSAPKPPKPPKPPQEPSIKIDKPAPGSKTEGLDISIDERGIRITPRAASAPATEAPSSTPAASAPASASTASSTVWQDVVRGAKDGWKDGPHSGPTVQITVPAGVDTEEVRRAVREAEQGIREAIQEARDAARAAAEDARDAAEKAQSASLQTRIRVVKFGDFLTDLAALWIIASIVIKITYKGQLQARAAAALATETAEAEQLKRQVVEARMAAMQAQVEPHFLFNTLASIDHLIETDPPRASRMQKSLIALLRATMPAMREGTVNGVRDLGQEIAVIEPYLEILKVRMEERLETQVDVPESLRSAEFPPMMVQGLVENAIKHGLEPQPQGGQLTVKAEIAHGQLVVTVTDTGVGFGKADTAGTGTGLANIRERLRLLYGDRARLDVSTPEGGGTQARVTLPYKAHMAGPSAGGVT
ncbi:MAG: histidine kinase [Rubrivivax sp.]|jgi:signal transduction histidine kinase|nr:histidine kinase [Rubrivivax sp.]